MAKQELSYKGKTLDQLKSMSTQDLFPLLPSRQRRSLKRGFTVAEKQFLAVVQEAQAGKMKKPIKTHCRNMVILPTMIVMVFQAYNGREFVSVQVTLEMLGHYLGEFAQTRKKVQHSAPGIGATKSSSALSVK